MERSSGFIEGCFLVFLILFVVFGFYKFLLEQDDQQHERDKQYIELLEQTYPKQLQACENQLEICRKSYEK